MKQTPSFVAPRLQKAETAKTLIDKLGIGTPGSTLLSVQSKEDTLQRPPKTNSKRVSRPSSRTSSTKRGASLKKRKPGGSRSKSKDPKGGSSLNSDLMNFYSGEEDKPIQILPPKKEFLQTEPAERLPPIPGSRNKPRQAEFFSFARSRNKEQTEAQEEVKAEEPEVVKENRDEDLRSLEDDGHLPREFRDYLYLGKFQDPEKQLDCPINIKKTEDALGILLQSQNQIPSKNFLVEPLSHDNLEALTLPGKLEAMTYIRQNTASLNANVDELIMKAVEKLDYVVRAVVEQTEPGTQVQLREVMEQAICLAVIDLNVLHQHRRENHTESVGSSTLKKSLRFQSSPQIDDQTTFLIESLNRVSANIDQIYHKSKVKQGKSLRKLSSQEELHAQNVLSQKPMKASELLEPLPLAQAKDSLEPLHLGLGNNLAALTSGMSPIERSISKEASSPKEAIPATRPISSEDFKLLIRVMGSWKTFAKQERDAKKEQVASTQKLILAIDFHEKSLALKVFRSCLANKIKKRRMEYAEKTVTSMVQQNMVRFYYKTMRAKFQRIQKRRYMRLIAKDYRKEELVKRTFQGWRKRTRVARDELSAMRSKLQNSYGAEILIEHLAFPFYSQEMPADLANSSDLSCLKFHAFATHSFTSPIVNKPNHTVEVGGRRIFAVPRLRLKPCRLRSFSESIEWILLEKQRRVLACWKQFRMMHKSFKEKAVLSFKRRVLQAMRGHLFRQRRIQAYIFQKDLRTMSIPFYTLLNFKIRRQIMKAASERVRSDRLAKIRETYFSEWRSLFSYFSMFTGSQAKYSQQLLSRLHFKEKYFRRLKIYTAMRKAHLSNIHLAHQVFFNKNIRTIFNAWAWLVLKRGRNVRFAHRTISRKVNSRIKTSFFRALQRAQMLKVETEEFRVRWLQQRVFMAYRQRKQFKELQGQLKLISNQQFEDNLLAKAYVGWARWAERQVCLRSLTVVFRQKRAERAKQLVFEGLVWAAEQGRERMQNFHIAKSKHERIIRLAVLEKLYMWKEKRRELRMARQEVEARRDSKLIRRTLFQILIVYHKRVLLHQIYSEVRDNKAQKLKIAIFRHLAINPDAKLRKEASESTIAVGDYLRSFHVKEASFKTHYRKRMAKRVFASWAAQAKRKAFLHKMESVCSFFFLNKTLTNCFGALKYNRHYRQCKAMAQASYEHRRQVAFFKVVGARAQRNAKMHQLKRAHRARVAENVFHELKNHARKEVGLRDAYDRVLAVRREILLTKTLGILANLHEIRRQQENQPLDFTEHQRFRAKSVLSRWRQVHKKRKANVEKAYDLMYSSHARIIKKHLKIWRTKLYLINLWKLKAVPFYDELIIRRRDTAFFKLKAQADKRKLKDAQIKQSSQYHRYSLLTKGLEVLRWQMNRQTERKKKVGLVEEVRKAIIRRKVFTILLHHKQKSQFKQDLTQTAFAHFNAGTKRRFLSIWRLRYKQKIMMKPLKALVPQFLAQNLKAKTFRALKARQELKKIKRTMNYTAEQFYRQMMLKKGIIALCQHTIKPIFPEEEDPRISPVKASSSPASDPSQASMMGLEDLYEHAQKKVESYYSESVLRGDPNERSHSPLVGGGIGGGGGGLLSSLYQRQAPLQQSQVSGLRPRVRGELHMRDLES